MSPRAACRLDALGFSDVYDYATGKVAWLAAGLPYEGSVGPDQRIASIARDDVPACPLGTRLADAPAPRDDVPCIVLDADRCVAGVVPKGAFALGPDVLVDRAMTPAPKTVRPSMRIDELTRALGPRQPYALVTTPLGQFLGAVTVGDVDGSTGGGS